MRNTATERETAQREYYSKKKTFETLNKAIKTAPDIKQRRKYKYVCSVKLDGLPAFYIVTSFDINFPEGAELGMWNELTLIRKL